MPAMKTTQQMRDELLLKGSGGTVKAPVTPTGFYSPLEEAALNIQRKSGNAQALMNDLRSVPKEHLQHAGVDRLLASRPTITREELQQHVAQAAPKVEVKVLGGSGGWSVVDQATGGDQFVENFRTEREAEARAQELGSRDYAAIPSSNTPMAETKYGQYTLPGGQNYREVLLTLPESKPSVSTNGWTATLLRPKSPVTAKPEFEIRDQEGNVVSVIRTADDSQRAINLAASQLYENKKRSANYRSNHWDEPNVLAHFRINDRTDKDGKKVLFVEEIQSDWGQEGKKRGFASPETKRIAGTAVPDEFCGWKVQWDDGTFSGGYNEASARAKAAEGKSNTRVGVPTAPFVTKTNDWVNLALKHIMKMAAEEGHDRVAFVKGEQAADRFGLDKHFSRVAARPTPTGGYQLQTILKDGSREDSVDVPPNKLHEYVGEDLAKKIHTQGGGVFEGGDLKMPQTGMRKFYDELVPQQAHALVKKFGGQGIKPIQVQTGEQGAQVVPNGTGWGVVWNDGVFTPAKSRQHADQLATPYSEHPGFDITPQMRQAILKPMSYKVGGAVPAMDAMRLQVWDKRRGR